MRNPFHRKHTNYYWLGRGGFAGVAVGPFKTEGEARQHGPTPLPAFVADLVSVTK